MSGESREFHPATKGRTIDRVGGSLVNLILGALILWVGQTTFRHAGLLASNKERFDSVGHQLKAVDDRHESLRDRLEQVFSQTNERTRSRFTREDGDKLGLRLREIEHQHVAFERQMVERLTSVQIKVIALETRDTSAHEIAMLRAEVDRLHTFIAQRPTGVLASYPNTVSSSANGGPVHLPPTIRR
jgi:hypothetical protein